MADDLDLAALRRLCERKNGVYPISWGALTDAACEIVLPLLDRLEVAETERDRLAVVLKSLAESARVVMLETGLGTPPPRPEEIVAWRMGHDKEKIKQLTAERDDLRQKLGNVSEKSMLDRVDLMEKWQQEVTELTAERDRLRTALAVFADRGSWCYHENGLWEWDGTGDHVDPAAFARRGLGGNPH